MTDAERTVASIASMLGWLNVPPRETLEADIRALKASARTSTPAPVTIPVYQCEEWQCHYVFPDQMCCIRPQGHVGDHVAAVLGAIPTGAVPETLVTFSTKTVPGASTAGPGTTATYTEYFGGAVPETPAIATELRDTLSALAVYLQHRREGHTSIGMYAEPLTGLLQRALAAIEEGAGRRASGTPAAEGEVAGETIGGDRDGKHDD